MQEDKGVSEEQSPLDGDPDLLLASIRNKKASRLIPVELSPDERREIDGRRATKIHSRSPEDADSNNPNVTPTTVDTSTPSETPPVAASSIVSETPVKPDNLTNHPSDRLDRNVRIDVAPAGMAELRQLKGEQYQHVRFNDETFTYQPEGTDVQIEFKKEETGGGIRWTYEPTKSSWRDFFRNKPDLVTGKAGTVLKVGKYEVKVLLTGDQQTITVGVKASA
jgi:hypothetical protein